MLKILDAVWAPKRMAVIHYQGHQKGDTIVILGNHKADQEAKLTASKGTLEPAALMATLFPSPLAEWDSKYSQHENTWFKTENGNYLPGGWWKYKDIQVAKPEALAPAYVIQ